VREFVDDKLRVGGGGTGSLLKLGEVGAFRGRFEKRMKEGSAEAGGPTGGWREGLEVMEAKIG
jgi:hypothetical protein